MLLALLATLSAEEEPLLEDRLERGSVPVYGQPYLEDLSSPERLVRAQPEPEPEVEVDQIWSSPEAEPRVEPALEPEFEPVIEAIVEQPPVEVVEAPVVARPPASNPKRAARRGTNEIDHWPVGLLLGSAAASTCVPFAGCAAVSGLSMIVASPERPPGMDDDEYNAYRDAYKTELRRRRLMMAIGGGLGGSIVGVILWAEFY